MLLRYSPLHVAIWKDHIHKCRNAPEYHNGHKYDCTTCEKTDPDYFSYCKDFYGHQTAN